MKRNIKNKKKRKDYDKINSCKRKLEIVKSKFYQILGEYKKNN